MAQGGSCSLKASDTGQRSLIHSSFHLQSASARCRSRRNVGALGPATLRPLNAPHDNSRHHLPAALAPQHQPPLCSSATSLNGYPPVLQLHPPFAMDGQPKRWGVTHPISEAKPTEIDLKLNDQLIEFLKEKNNFETPEGTDRRYALSLAYLLTQSLITP